MLDDLKAFVAVVDRASLTKAADTLSLTQSAVSRRIQQLEESLNTRLLDRSTKPPAATAIGRRVYEAAIPLLHDLERLARIAREDEDPSGTLRLGLPQMVADVALFDMARRVKAQFPALDLQCHTEWSSALQRELSSGRLDAAALILPPGGERPAGLRSEFITSLEIAVVQSRDRPVADEPAGMAGLAKLEWILNPQGCGYRAALERAMEGAGRHVRLGVDMHGTETQLRLVAEGLGLGLVPRSLLANSTYRDALSVIDVPDFQLTLELWLAAPADLGNLSRAYGVLHHSLADCFCGPSGTSG